MSKGLSTGSFRDPSGFIFRYDGKLYRQVNTSYRENYDELISCGLYDTLAGKGLLIPHKESDTPPRQQSCAYKVLEPEPLDFISYPYEWSFSALKDAALMTLEIQKIAMDKGMSLKDASAYNVQFRASRPVFIDTLSFEKYAEGSPWVAYRQFCQHFLAPLALMSRKDIRLGQLLKSNIDGIPLDLASSLLPHRTYLSFALLSHIHLHARSQKHFQDKAKSYRGAKVSKLSLMGLIDNLKNIISCLDIKTKDFTGWADYYDKTNYTKRALEHKRSLVKEYLSECKPQKIWDIGANTGIFSRLFSGEDTLCVSFDLDPYAVDLNYRIAKKNDDPVLPLVLDLTNPSPSLGWDHSERMSLKERGPADAVIALALIHHMCIGNNLPFAMVASFLSDITKELIIEFVPKEDSQIRKMLSTREDIFTDYSRESFEKEFKKHFNITRSDMIKDSNRVLYLMASTCS